MTWLLIVPMSESAHAKCTGNFINLITDVCWECLFPITIASIPIVKGDLPIDFLCLEGGSFDLAYLTELDPLWSEDKVARLASGSGHYFDSY